MISRINVRLRWLRRRSSRTYLIARLFGLDIPKGETSEPGLIFVQIDGLARTHFEQAIKERRLPFLERLIRRQHFTLENFYSGVPSTTPAVQGELFFGVRAAVPSFQFLHREDGKVHRMYEPDSANEIERQLLEACPQPLLEGAHVYSNIYPAGARQSWYCSRDFSGRVMWKRFKPFNWLVLSIFYIAKVLRILCLSLVEFALAVIDMFHGLFKREDFVHEFMLVPARVIICAALREFIRFRVLMDIERGVQVIHANFLGYDEQAHRRGPDSAFAYWTLKGIDRAIRDIYRAAEGSDYRDYELIVYSDHGQEHTTPFQKRHGKTIDAAVAEVFATGPTAGFPVWMPKLPRALGNAIDACRTFLSFVKKPPENASVCDPENQIVLSAMGPIGHVYLPVTLEPEAKRDYAKRLVKEAGIPLVLLPADQPEIEAYNSAGSWKLPQDAAEVLGREHPFLQEAAEDLAALARHPDAGDFLISGWDPNQTPLTFPLENGAHAGPGPDETRGFLLLPDRIERWHLKDLVEKPGRIRPEELRKIALHYLGRDRPEKKADAPATRSTSTSPSNGTLRVATYNIHSCRGIDGKTRPERIARVLNRLQADVIGVQEVDVHRPRSGTLDQAKEIAVHLEMEHTFYDVLVEETERYGIAVFSRYPFQIRRMALLTEAGIGREARGAMWLEVTPEEDFPPFHFFNTHFGLGRDERRRQAEVLTGPDWLGAIPEDEPVVVCGDFNSVPGSTPWIKLNRVLRDAQLRHGKGKPLATFSSIKPLLRIDHVFTSEHFEVHEITVPKTSSALMASDHLPLCIELSLKKE